jgi:TfoX/Sxy family transcriptional regulator of competence genes
MATKAETVEYLVSRMLELGNVYARRMFGEYGVYCDDKMFALICDDQLFIKPTTAGKAYLGEYEEGQPYPRAKHWLLIPEDDWEDAPRLTELIRLTLQEIKPVKKKAKRT